MTWAKLFAALSEPFPDSAISFRPGKPSRDRKRAQALAYAEPRVYEDRLNDVVGPDWSCRFITWGEQRLICELSVTIDEPGGTRREVVRTSTGEFDSSDRIAQGTSAEAQAFKRACSKFGLGRYLYDLPTLWVDYDEQSRRLTETPVLPKTKSNAPRTMPLKPEAVPSGIKLSADRAASMQREMQKLGFERPLQFMQQHLDTKRSYTQLTEEEALEVWNAARKEAAVLKAAPRKAA